MFARANYNYIFAHASMGSTVSDLSAGKPILIMPRRAYVGEQGYDHQYTTAQRLETKEGILVVMNKADLPLALDTLVVRKANPSTMSNSEFADPKPVAAVRSYVHGELDFPKRPS